MTTPPSLPGVSFVVPVRNGAPWLRTVFDAIWRQADGRPMEVIAVHDGSDDGSGEILEELAAATGLRIITGAGHGAAACINAGIRAARFPIVCQVDQDVILGSGWMRRVTAALVDPGVAAAQGCYTSDPTSALLARVMALDLAQRYDAMGETSPSHVCTGNTAYRAEHLRQVGLFDEHLGYGYDNDMSYRLQDAGYRLIFCREARSLHRWRDSFAGYCAQQYGFGYGRLDLVAKHPRRATGDSVSPLPMMLHPLLALAALGLLTVGAFAALTVGGARLPLQLGGLLLGLLVFERSVAGVRAQRRWRDLAALLFPLFHLVRDAVWAGGIVVWSARRVAGLRARPSHSMAPRRHAPHELTAIESAAGAKASGGMIARAADHGAQT